MVVLYADILIIFATEPMTNLMRYKMICHLILSLPIPTNDTNQGTLPPTMELRHSSRVRYPPDRYTPNVN